MPRRLEVLVTLIFIGGGDVLHSNGKPAQVYGIGGGGDSYISSRSYAKRGGTFYGLVEIKGGLEV